MNKKRFRFGKFGFQFISKSFGETDHAALQKFYDRTNFGARTDLMNGAGRYF